MFSFLYLISDFSLSQDETISSNLTTYLYVVGKGLPKINIYFYANLILKPNPDWLRSVLGLGFTGSYRRLVPAR